MFCKKDIFYGEGLLAPRLTPKLEDHPLSVAAYSMSWQLLSTAGGLPSIYNPKMCHAVVTRDPPPNMGNML
jgi:hypothetical protein